MTRHLDALIETSRIRATSVVIVADDVSGTIHDYSREAAVVFFGFEAPQEGSEIAFHRTMERLAGKLPRTIFVDSAGGMELET